MKAICGLGFPSSQQSRRLVPASVLGAALILVGAGGCGRPRAAEPLENADEVSIAGVSVTSPDEVVTVVPTSPVPSTQTETTQRQPTQKLYTIQDGDTVSKIAEDHGIPVDVLVQANGITDVHSIRPGEELLIPIPPPVDVTVSTVGPEGSTVSTTP